MRLKDPLPFPRTNIYSPNRAVEGGTKDCKRVLESLPPPHAPQHRYPAPGLPLLSIRLCMPALASPWPHAPKAHGAKNQSSAFWHKSDVLPLAQTRCHEALLSRFNGCEGCTAVEAASLPNMCANCWRHLTRDTVFCAEGGGTSNHVASRVQQQVRHIHTHTVPSNPCRIISPPCCQAYSNASLGIFSLARTSNSQAL